MTDSHRLIISDRCFCTNSYTSGISICTMSYCNRTFVSIIIRLCSSTYSNRIAIRSFRLCTKDDIFAAIPICIFT